MGDIQRWIESAQSLGVVSIICLLDGEHLSLYPDNALLDIYRTAGFEVRHIPARDHQVPPLDTRQLTSVLEAWRTLPKPVLIQCSTGFGRTGAAWAHILEHGC